MPEANMALNIYGKTYLSQAQAQLQALYRTGTRGAKRMTTQVQMLGHHNLAALNIFKGLALYRGFGAVTQQLAEGVQRAIEFEKAMANVDSLLQVSRGTLLMYKDYLAELGQRLPLTMQELAEGMYDIVSAGITAEGQIKAVAELAGKAAVAGVTDLKNAVQAGIGTMNAYGKSVDDLEHIYDVHFMTVKMGILTYEQLNQVLGRVSSSASLAGQAMETATAALVAISRGGFGGAAFEEGSTRVVRFFQELSDTSAQQKIQAMGIAVFDSFGKMRNAIDIVTDLQGKLATMTDEARQATINQIFTNIRSAQGFTVLAEQLDVWREAQMQSIFSGGAMEDAFSRQIGTIAATFTQIQNKFTNGMRGMFEVISPVLSGFGDFMDLFGRNFIQMGVIITLIVGKFAVLGAISKMQARHEELRMAQLQRQAILDEQLIAAEQQKALVKHKNLEIDRLRMQITAFRIAQENEANVQKKIATLQSEIYAHALERENMLNQKDYNLKEHNIQQNQKAIQVKTKLLQQLEREYQALQRITVEQAKRINVTEQKIANDTQEINQTKIKIDAYGLEKKALDGTIYSLQFRNKQMAANIAAMAGMTIGMGLLTTAATTGHKWLKTLGAAITGITIGLQTYTSILPTLISLMAAQTGVVKVQEGAYWGLATAKAAATGGITAIGMAIGISAALGLITFAMMELTTATADTTDEMDNLGDAMITVGDIADDTQGKVAAFVRDLIMGGETIGVIAERVKEAASTFEGFNTAAVSGLIKARYTTVDGVGLMQPAAIAREFFPKEGEERYKGWVAALESLKFTSEEIARIHAGDGKLLVEMQNRLLSQQEIIRDTATEMIFGKEMTSSLSAMWDLGQRLEMAGSETQAALTYANNEVKKIRTNIEAIEPTLTELLEKGERVVGFEFAPGTTGAKVKERFKRFADALDIPQLGQEFEYTIPSGYTGAGEKYTGYRIYISESDLQTMREYVDKLDSTERANYYTNLLTDYFKEAVAEPIADVAENFNIPPEMIEDYHTLTDLSGQLVKFTEMAAANTELTNAQLAKQAINLAGMTKDFDPGAIGDMIDGILANSKSLDDAGIHFQGVAGRWDVLGQRWSEIQSQWEAISVIESLLSMASNLREIAIPNVDTSSMISTIDDAISGMSPMLETMLGNIAGDISFVFGSLGENLSNEDFWKTIMEPNEMADAVAETVEEGMMEIVDAVTGISQLDDFINQLVEAGSTLDDAGYHFKGVAGNWDRLGEDWKKIQKMWMGLEIMQTLMSVVSDMAGAAQTMVETGTHTEQQWTGEYKWETVYTQAALDAQEKIKNINYSMDKLINAWGGYENMPTNFQKIYNHYQRVIASLADTAKETERVRGGKIYETVEVSDYESILGEGAAGTIEDMRQKLVEALLPILQTMTGNAAGGLIDILQGMLGNLGNPGFWDTLFADSQAEAVKTIEEMAEEYISMARKALDVGSAFDAFAEYGEVLESAGFYFKDVAGNWAVVGEEWARIQSYFQVQQMINTFIQSAKAMEEYGLVLPQEFQNTMYALMQQMAVHVIPDFQGLMDNLMDELGSEDFWSALAEGMAKADIRQSNSITIAPYIVIEARDDDEAIIDKVHDALVGEAKKAGFNWG